MFLKSFKKNAAPGTELEVFTTDMPEEIAKITREHGGRVRRVSALAKNNGLKDRHIHYARLLSTYTYSDNPSDLVLTIDARDTIIQRDPFEFLATQKKACLSAESGTVSQEKWNTEDQQKFQASRASHAKNENWRDFVIVNGGFVGGRVDQVLPLLLARIATDSAPAESTDQASLTWFANSFGGVGNFTVIPKTVPWIYHGFWHAFDQLKFNSDYLAVEATTGLPYAVLHQWDRIPEMEQTLTTHYLGET